MIFTTLKFIRKEVYTQLENNTLHFPLVLQIPVRYTTNMAVLFIFFNIVILYVSVVLADVDDSTTTEIFNRLDELGRKVTSLENKNIALEHLIEKQNDTIEVLRSDLRKMQETLPQEDLILKNEIKILEYRKLGSLQKELLELEQKVVKNVTQSKLMLESQDAKWTQNFVSLNDTVTKIESNQSLIKATMDDRFTVLEETLALTPQHGDISQLESTLKSSVNKINGLENEVKTNKMALEFKIDSDVKEVKDSLVVTNTAVQEMDNKLNQRIGVLETELVNLQYTTNDTKGTHHQCTKYILCNSICLIIYFLPLYYLQVCSSRYI